MEVFGEVSTLCLTSAHFNVSYEEQWISQPNGGGGSVEGGGKRR